MKTWLSRTGSFYIFTCVILVNTLLVFLLFNFVIEKWISRPFTLQHEGDTAQSPLLEKYYPLYQKQIYPDFSKTEINILLNQTGMNAHEFQPFIMFKSAPIQKKYMIIHEAGFRSIGHQQGSWPPDSKNFNIFVFGGSTALGAGVANEDTLPAYLQSELANMKTPKPVRVYNFATGSYFSTQERIQFEQLLLEQKIVPDMALFIDGLNDFYFWDGVPANASIYSDTYNEVKYRARSDWRFFGKQLLNYLPVKVLFQQMHAPSQNMTSASPQKQDETPYQDLEKINNVIQRYAQNKKMIEALASAYGIQTYFIWQPVPLYGYDRSHQYFQDFLFGHTRSKYGYPEMKKYIEQHPMGTRFIWAADIQEGLEKNLYLDNVHYAPEMNKLLAETIAHHISFKQ